MLPRLNYVNRSPATPAPDVVLWHEDARNGWVSVPYAVIRRCTYGNGRQIPCPAALTASLVDFHRNQSLPIAVCPGRDYAGSWCEGVLRLHEVGTRSDSRIGFVFEDTEQIAAVAVQRSDWDVLRQRVRAERPLVLQPPRELLAAAVSWRVTDWPSLLEERAAHAARCPVIGRPGMRLVLTGGGPGPDAGPFRVTPCEPPVMEA